MRIVVTGGSGYLGAHTVSVLARSGHQVVSLDTTPCPHREVEWHVVDLRRREAPYPYLRDTDIVLHLANHNTARKADAQTVLTENVAMNAHVFEASAELGVRRLVFASSIQAMSGGPLMPGEQYAPYAPENFPTLPIDGDTPGRAGNVYGLSKVFGEQHLAQLAGRRVRECIAVRFPFLAMAPARLRQWRPEHPHAIAEAYAWLWIEDATRLLLALCTAEALPGYRVYHPAGPLLPDWPEVETLAQRFMPGAARRNTGQKLTSFFDLKPLERELGWRPTPWSQIPDCAAWFQPALDAK
jgi:UDP-glucose 4-epimerase